jgi:hypothetical protein
MKEQFKQFLKSKKLFKLFCKYIKEQRNISFDTCIKLVNFPSNYVWESFTWDKTNEGGEFWNHITQEWEAIVDKEREKENGKQQS